MFRWRWQNARVLSRYLLELARWQSEVAREPDEHLERLVALLPPLPSRATDGGGDDGAAAAASERGDAPP